MRVPDLSLERLPPTDIADVLLLAVAQRRVTAIHVEPTGDGHVLAAEQATLADAGGDAIGPVAVEFAALPAALGDAVAARLAILCDLPFSPTPQLGELRVRVGELDRSLLISVRAGGGGLAAEVRRIADAEDDRGAAVTADGSHIGVYRMYGPLGSGGMGTVYRAEHTLLGKPVAIKVLHPEAARDARAAARFLREARAASRVRHPGVVDVVDFGTLPDGGAFLVMELVEGRTLEAVIAQDQALPPVRAIGIARRIAAVLAAAHEAGVVHRDLKPANVFVLGGDQVKIVDFGIAKVIEPPDAAALGRVKLPSPYQAVPVGGDPSLTLPGMVVGTPHYMAPEQARGETDPRTDLYALGCILFEMLTGRPPFEGRAPMEVIAGHLAGRVPPLRVSSGPVPESLERCLRRALAKDPDERHQRADELAEELDAVAAVLARGDWRRWLP